MQKLKLQNNLSDDSLFIIDEENLDGNLYKKYLDLSNKQNEISKIKHELTNFRGTLEAMDFVKNTKENKEKLDNDLKKYS